MSTAISFVKSDKKVKKVASDLAGKKLKLNWVGLK
jgi:hypothetical protein